MKGKIISAFCYDLSTSSWRILAETKAGSFYWLVKNWIYPDPPHTAGDEVTIPRNAKKI